MKLRPKKVINMTLFLFVCTIIISCAKDTDLLLASVINDPEIALEESESLAEESTAEEQEDVLVSRTLTFSPISDAYLQDEEGHDKTIIRLQENLRTSYLKFDLSQINGTITDAVLQFSIDSDEGDGSILIHKGESTLWTEENLNINNAPAVEIQLGSMNKSYTIGDPEKVTLDSNEIKAEITTLVMSHSSGNDLAFASKEHPDNIGPKLVIVYETTEDATLTEQEENDSSTETSTEQETATTTEIAPIETPNLVTGTTASAYYVTTSGSASANGLSENTAWSIEHAFESAVAGDIVYIKAGDYGAKNLNVNNSGSADEPIKFIGYTNTPGDLVSSQGSTFKYGETLNQNKMPLLKMENGEYGIRVNEDYIVLENIQLTRYRIGVLATGTNIVLRNIVAVDLGTQSDYDAYDGFGIHIYGNNALLENCFVQNATAEAIKLSGSNNSKIDYSTVHADNPSNPTDYYFLLTGGTEYTTIENSYAERALGLIHGGHGFDLKDQAEYNIIKNCVAKRTSFEFNFSGVKNNTFLDNSIIGVDTDPSNWHASVVIANGANNNLIKNMYIENTWAAIRLIDYDDGFVGPGGDRDEVSLGYDNTFDNLTIKNTNRILNIGDGNYIGASAQRNKFINSNFTDFSSVAIVYYTAEDFSFTNCTFDNGENFIIEAQSYSNFDATWNNCSWSNINFTPPN